MTREVYDMLYLRNHYRKMYNNKVLWAILILSFTLGGGLVAYNIFNRPKFLADYSSPLNFEGYLYLAQMWFAFSGLFSTVLFIGYTLVAFLKKYVFK